MTHFSRTSSILLSLVALAILGTSNGAYAQPVSPVIAVNPAQLDFGRVCVGDCRDLIVNISNSQPGTTLIITGLTAAPGPTYTLVSPPATPFNIPGDGTQVPVTVRFCPPGPGPFAGTFTITSSNANNSPRIVPLSGSGNRPPVCNANGPYSGDVGESIAFNGSGSSDPDGGPITYAWNFGDGGTATGATPSHTYNAGGVFPVSLTVTDDCGATSQCQTTADINALPVCDAGGPYVGTAGVPVNFDGTGSSDDGTIVSYAWNFGDGNTGSGATPSHTYAAAGSYPVTLTVTDNDGASSTCETVADIAEPGNLPPNCNAGGPYGGQAGLPVQFDGTGSNDPDGNIVLYEWDFGDGNTGTGAMPTHTYAIGGTYVVTLCVTDNDGARACCETFADIGGTAVELISFTATSGDGTVHLSWRTGFEQDHAGFDVLRAPEGSDAFVRVAENLRDEDDGSLDHAYSFEDGAVVAGGSYLYQLEAVDLSGGRQTFSPILVTVSLPANLVLHPSRPNPFNPFHPSTMISFDLPVAERVTVRIYDSSGRLIRTLADAATFPAGVHALPWDGSDQRGGRAPSGVYMIKLGTGSTLLTEKIVLTR